MFENYYSIMFAFAKHGGFVCYKNKGISYGIGKKRDERIHYIKRS